VAFTLEPSSHLVAEDALCTKIIEIAVTVGAVFVTVAAALAAIDVG
jgi:hypothetical protein